MGEQAGKERNFGSRRLDLHLPGDLQTLRKFLEKHVNIAIEKGDWAQEGAVYGYLGNLYFSHSDFRKAIEYHDCLLYTSPSPRDLSTSRMPSSA